MSEWLLATDLNRRRRDQLVELLDAVPGWSWPHHRLTRSEMIEELRAERAKHWSGQQSGVHSPKGAKHWSGQQSRVHSPKRQTATRICTISAAEADEWLLEMARKEEQA